MEVRRKLIRPSFQEMKSKVETKVQNAPAPQQQQPPPNKKANPQEQTNAENFYYVKQMQAKTPMAIVLRDGETLSGVIEWYDKACIRVQRDGGPHVLIYKPSIKYMYKRD